MLVISAVVFVFAQASFAAAETTNSIDRRQYMLAEGMFERQFFDLAEAEFKKFINTNPDNPLAPRSCFRLAECQRAQDKNQEALATIARMKQKWPEHELAQKIILLEADLLQKLGETEKAAAAYRLLIGNQNTQLRETARFFLAQLLENTEQVNVAKTLYSSLANQEFDGNHQYRPYAMFALANLSQRENKVDEANKLYKKLAQAESAPARLRRDALRQRAENLFNQKEYQEAVKAYENLMVQAEEKSLVKWAQSRRIWCLYSMGKFAETIELAQEWHHQYPEAENDFSMNFIMAAALTARESFVNALEWFEKAKNSESTPSSYKSEIDYQIIYCHMRLMQWKQVDAKADLFIKSHQDSPRLHKTEYIHARALFELQNYEDAVKKIQALLADTPESWSNRKTANLLLANCLQKQEKYTAAATVFRKLANIEGDTNAQVKLRLNAADLAKKAGNWQDAIADCNRILDTSQISDQQRRRTIVLLAQLHIEHDTPENAIAALQNLKESSKNENQAKIQLLLAYMYLRQNMLDAAEPELRQLVEGKNGATPEIKIEARQMLTDALLRQNETNNAIIIFSPLLELPENQRPNMPDSLLFELQKLYFNRNEYELSEKVCRWLVEKENPKTKSKALVRLAEILISTNRFEQAKVELEKITKLTTTTKIQEWKAELGAAKVLMGDIYREQNKNDRAAMTYQTVLDNPALPMRYATKARLELARLLNAEGRPNQALRHAVNAFVLGEDPVYTPQAMMLTIEILIKLDKSEEAKTTWNELQKRFPVFAEGQKSDNKTLEKIIDLNSN